MRTFQVATVAVLLFAATAARAEDATGTYDIKYEEVANNCASTGMSLNKGSLSIRKEKNDLVVDIARVPKMLGKPNKNGAVRATSRTGPTSIEKVDGKFSVAGRVDDGTLQLVFVAEYYDKGTPLCTQSWNIVGTRDSGETKAKAKSFGLSLLPQ